MTSRTRIVATAALLALAAAALYMPRLDEAPRYLVTDELFSALTARAVATTGRDPHGAFLPLYFQMDLPKNGSPMWFQPTLLYAMTFALKVLPFSEATIRLPMACAGVLDVVLMYLVGRLLFSRELFAIAAACLLALTPVHFMYSRYAMDFQAPLPFLLGWLLCLLTYLKRGDARMLFVAGLVLGAGVYSYIAAAAFMPLYALLTMVVLWMRRAPVKSYAVLGAGCVLPLLLLVPALYGNPTMLRDIVAHYQPDEAPAGTAAAQSIGSLIAPARFREAVQLYVAFWNPRFLFVDGPLRASDATWLVGVFLLPVAGLLLVGVARALRRPFAPMTVVLMAGLLTAPIPASFAGQGEAIRRALELVPFAVLIGVVGLEAMWADKADVAKTIGFVAFWTVVIALAVASHDHVPRAQAYVRAASVPLGIAGLAIALDRFPFDRLRVWPLLVPAAITMIASQVAYFLGWGAVVDAATIGALAAAIVFRREPAESGRRPIALSVLLALVSSEFTFQYVDYPVGRLGVIPASAILVGLRLLATAVVIGASFVTAQAARSRADRLSHDTVVAFAIIGAAYVQVAYFFVDWFTTPLWRFVHVATVVVAAVKVATLSKPGEPSALRLGPLTAVGVLGLVCLQFAYFYADYFKEFQARGSGAAVGNVRLALETAIDRAGDRPVPAIYLARVRNESPGLGALFAKFYLIKKQREDLVDRTVEGEQYMGFEVDRVSALPPGSLVIVNPSNRNERIIDEMTASGALKRDQLLKTPDGTPMFWILERTAR